MMTMQTKLTRPSLARSTRTSRASTVSVLAFREDDARQKAGKALNKTADKAKQVAGTAGRRAQQAANGNGRMMQQRGQQAADQARRVAEGDSEVEGFGNPLAYAGLAAGFAANAGGFFALPTEAARLVFAGEYGTPYDFLHDPLLRILAIGLSAAAVLNWVQKDAAGAGDLGETLHRRLNGSLAFFGAGQIFLQGLAFTPLAGIYLGTYGADLINAPVAIALGGVAGLQWLVAGRNYAKVSPEGANPVAIVQSFVSDASQTFSGADTTLAKAYAFLTAVFLGAGFSYLFLPFITLDAVFGGVGNKGPEDVLTWQLIGAGVAILLGPTAYSLKEAASDGELADGRYRALNLAVLTAAVGHIAVLGPLLGTENAGPLLPALLGAWVGAGAISTIGFTQRE